MIRKDFAAALMASASAIGLVLASGCSTEEPPAVVEVSFSADVVPVINEACLECHQAPDGKGFVESGLSVESYDDLMKGTKFGPVVMAGDSVNSTLIRLVDGKADPSLKMPHGANKLPDEQRTLLRDWVDQGAKQN